MDFRQPGTSCATQIRKAEAPHSTHGQGMHTTMNTETEILRANLAAGSQLPTCPYQPNDNQP